MEKRRQILFVQGGGEGAHDEWDNRLVDSLAAELGGACEIRYPRMPMEEDPDYGRWKAAIDGEIDRLDAGAILVAHSVGATILVRCLTERPDIDQLQGIYLIAAPFIGEGGWPSDDFRFPDDLGGRLPARVPIHFFHGSEDDTAPLSHLELYAAAIPQAQAHDLPGRDHQLNDDLREVAQAIRADEAAGR